VLDRPYFPGTLRTVTSWLGRALVGGGVAAAVIGALLTWWLNTPPGITATNCGVAAGGDITVGRDLRTECPPAVPGRD
jgi:hypothetical protein